MSRFFVSLLLVLRERTGHTGQLGYQGGCDIQLQYDILQRAALGWLCLCLKVKTHSWMFRGGCNILPLAKGVEFALEATLIVLVEK